MKRLVKEATKRTAFKYLIELKGSLSKMKDLHYSDLSLQPYLVSDKLNTREKKFLYLLTVRMTNVGHNYGKKTICQTCNMPGTEDDQKHALTECVYTTNNNNVNYQDIFSNDIDKMSQAAKHMHDAYRKREILLGRQER